MQNAGIPNGVHYVPNGHLSPATGSISQASSSEFSLFAEHWQKVLLFGGAGAGTGMSTCQEFVTSWYSSMSDTRETNDHKEPTPASEENETGDDDSDCDDMPGLVSVFIPLDDVEEKSNQDSFSG